MTTLSCKYITYPEDIHEEITVTGETEQEAFINLLDHVGSYLSYEDIEDDDMTTIEIIACLDSSNGDGCDFIVFLKNETTGEVYFDGDFDDYDYYEDDEDDEEYEDEEY